ncbi:MAG TPA: DUF968 domain-containing protein [bacterium]|nr:DUF968 domain-containing protein [bacterium]
MCVLFRRTTVYRITPVFNQIRGCGVSKQNPITERILRICKRRGYSKQYMVNWMRAWHCTLCGEVSAPPHHIVSRGAGGSDDKENLLAFCSSHHTEIHNIGIQTFANKYPEVKERIVAAIDHEKVGLS